MMKKVVGLTSGRKFENYRRWLTETNEVELVPLSHEESNFEMIKKCAAVVLSGGEDVHPKFYKKPEYVDKYALTDLDEKRDEFEMRILSYADRKHLPLLGICRGLQIANVFFGGTLLPDIQSFGKPPHVKLEEGKDRYHPVWLTDNTLLREITGTRIGEVNSAHHQCVDLMGKGLTMNAVSPDGLIEGLEKRDREDRAFFLLVQWHPERMQDPASPFALNIREKFLSSIRAKSI